MDKAIMGAVVSLDGFIADDRDDVRDDVRALFDWYDNGDVTWSFPGTDDEFRTTQASADFMQSLYRDVAAVVIGRRLFDLTNGWNGKPAAREAPRAVHIGREAPRKRTGGATDNLPVWSPAG